MKDLKSLEQIIRDGFQLTISYSVNLREMSSELSLTYSTRGNSFYISCSHCDFLENYPRKETSTKDNKYTFEELYNQYLKIGYYENMWFKFKFYCDNNEVDNKSFTSYQDYDEFEPIVVEYFNKNYK